MIAFGVHTGILFDGVKGEVHIVDHGSDLESIYALLKCDLVDTMRLDKNHIVFVDDEGLFKNYGHGFSVEYGHRKISFVGSGLLVGDKFGETCSITLNPSDLKITYTKYDTAKPAQEEENV